jgi:hypothetical protein
MHVIYELNAIFCSFTPSTHLQPYKSTKIVFDAYNYILKWLNTIKIIIIFCNIPHLQIVSCGLCGWMVVVFCPSMTDGVSIPKSL